MSKVTIKFWDKESHFYEEDAGLVIDAYGGIYDINADPLYSNSQLNEWYEAHFFVNGERIA